LNDWYRIFNSFGIKTIIIIIIIIFLGIKCIWIIFKFDNETDEADAATFKCDDETDEVEVDDITRISSPDIVQLKLIFDEGNIKKREKFRF
jgi:hypothetical protein